MGKDEQEMKPVTPQRVPETPQWESAENSSFAKRTKELEAHDPQGPSEEEDAWKATLLLYPWVSGVLWRGRDRANEGKPMQNEDLLKLPTDESCRTVYEEVFLPRWQEEIVRAEAAAKANEAIDADHTAACAQAESEGRPAPKEPKREVDKPQLFKVLAKCWWPSLAAGAFCRLIADGCQVATPFFLREIINWLEKFGRMPEGTPGRPSAWEGYVWSAALGVNMLLSGFANQACLFFTTKAFMNMRSVVTLAIFDKAILMGGAHGLTGRVLAMHSTDTSKFLEGAFFAQNVWASPMMAVAALGGLYYFIGWAGVLSIIILLVNVPVQGALAGVITRLRAEGMRIADKRLQAVHEFVQGIRIVKFMNWEEKFAERTESFRQREIGVYKGMFAGRSIFLALISYVPQFVIFCVIAMAFKWFDREINAITVFPTVAMLNVLRIPVTLLPLAIMRLIDIGVAMGRITSFLQLPDHVDYVEQDTKMKAALEISNADIQCLVGKQLTTALSPLPDQKGQKGKDGEKEGFEGASPDESKPEDATAEIGEVKRETLMRVPKLSLPRNKLTIIVGATASGKSTLISALIGESLVTDDTRVQCGGSVAYVAQEAWIMNATLRENIILGSDYNEKRYVDTVNACQLMSDLEQLSASDQTEIGERGINLSGGQKQRVAFARAVYSGRDIVVMDDPLSAVDPHVCQALFHDCIDGALKSKTRVLVTHQQQFLPFADRVVLVDQLNVVFSGTYDELMKRPELHDLLGRAEAGSGRQSPTASAAKSTEVVDEPQTPAVKKRSTIPPPKKHDDGTLVQSEQMESGDVRIGVFLWYFRLYGIHWGALVVFAFAAWRVGSIFAELILSWWSGRDTLVGYDADQDQFLLWYFVAVIVTGVLVFIRQIPFVIGSLRASRNAHSVLVDNLLHAPISFFDTTPTGRIINRFSKDMEILDIMIPESLNFFLNMLFVMLGAWATMIVGMYWIAIAIVVLLAFFVVVYSFYITTNGALKRLDSVNRSPVAVTLTELLGGLASIRAYGLAPHYRSKHLRQLENSAKSSYNWRNVQRWLGIRVDFVSGLIGLFTCLVAVAIIHRNDDRQSRIDALPMIELAATYSVGIAGAMGFFTTIAAELAASFSSVERIQEYTENVPREREVEYTEGPDGDFPAPPAVWPQHGAVDLSHVSLRYRPGLPLVLKDVTCSIKAGEKVGVVGRTGSGKSTLMLALFRMIELAEEESTAQAPCRISIDGVDISKLKLPDLRSKITIIPQDPVLFVGTVRSNLDPFATHTDQRLWEVLEHSGMADRVRREDAGLDATVVEKGTNFSTGERQLLCLARAMLKDCKVLLLDEATASIDPQQDELLQRTIRREFTKCTVLTIAHRLGTIIDADKVLVLKDGNLEQFGSPAGLLSDPAGLFFDMVSKLGPELASELTHTARNAAMKRGEKVPSTKAVAKAKSAQKAAPQEY